MFKKELILFTESGALHLWMYEYFLFQPALKLLCLSWENEYLYSKFGSSPYMVVYFRLVFNIMELWEKGKIHHI